MTGTISRQRSRQRFGARSHGIRKGHGGRGDRLLTTTRRSRGRCNKRCAPNQPAPAWINAPISSFTLSWTKWTTPRRTRSTPVALVLHETQCVSRDHVIDGMAGRPSRCLCDRQVTVEPRCPLCQGGCCTEAGCPHPHAHTPVPLAHSKLVGRRAGLWRLPLLQEIPPKDIDPTSRPVPPRHPSLAADLHARTCVHPQTQRAGTPMRNVEQLTAVITQQL